MESKFNIDTEEFFLALSEIQKNEKKLSIERVGYDMPEKINFKEGPIGFLLSKINPYLTKQYGLSLFDDVSIIFLSNKNMDDISNVIDVNGKQVISLNYSYLFGTLSECYKPFIGALNSENDKKRSDDFMTTFSLFSSCNYYKEFAPIRAWVGMAYLQEYTKRYKSFQTPLLTCYLTTFYTILHEYFHIVDQNNYRSYCSDAIDDAVLTRKEHFADINAMSVYISATRKIDEDYCSLTSCFSLVSGQCC